MSSCPSYPLTAEEKAALRESREEQLREVFREAIVRDLLTLYTAPYSHHGENPLGELLETMDSTLGIDRKRIFLSVLKDVIPVLEGMCDAGSETKRDPVQA